MECASKSTPAPLQTKGCGTQPSVYHSAVTSNNGILPFIVAKENRNEAKDLSATRPCKPMTRNLIKSHVPAYAFFTDRRRFQWYSLTNLVP